MADNESRRGGFWRRLARWFGSPDPAPVPRRQVVLEDDVLVVDTPSLDDAFDFRVSVRITWTTVGGTEEELASHVQLFRPHVHRLVRREIRAAVRGVAPNGAEQAEGLVNNALGCLADTSQFTDSGITWAVHAHVGLPDPVRSGLQERWLSVLRQEAEHDLTLLRIRHLRALVAEWKKLLDEDLGIKPAPYLAGRLVRLAAHPHEIAATMDALTADRVALNDQMLRVVRDAMARHQHLGVFEFVTTYDLALRQVMDFVNGLEQPFPLDDLEDGRNTEAEPERSGAR